MERWGTPAHFYAIILLINSTILPPVSVNRTYGTNTPYKSSIRFRSGERDIKVVVKIQKLLYQCFFKSLTSIGAMSCSKTKSSLKDQAWSETKIFFGTDGNFLLVSAVIFTSFISVLIKTNTARQIICWLGFCSPPVLTVKIYSSIFFKGVILKLSGLQPYRAVWKFAYHHSALWNVGRPVSSIVLVVVRATLLSSFADV